MGKKKGCDEKEKEKCWRRRLRTQSALTGNTDGNDVGREWKKVQKREDKSLTRSHWHVTCGYSARFPFSFLAFLSFPPLPSLSRLPRLAQRVMESSYPSRRVSFDLISLASPPRSSSAAPTQSFQYIGLAQDADQTNEKAISFNQITREQGKKRPPSLSRQPSRCDHPPSSAPASSANWTPYADSARQVSHTPSPSQFFRQPMSIPTHSRASVHSSAHPRSTSDMIESVRPWLPLIMYAVTSLAFVVAFSFYRTELFTCRLIPFLS